MPFVMELDTAVEVMARGLARGQPTIAYPLPMVAMVKAAAALPGPIWEALAATLPFTRPPK
jgi:hypothetical protein